MKITGLITALLLFHFSASGQEKTFVREYTYKASELDSKVSCRAIATNQLRSILLNEIGVYVENEQVLKTTEIGGKFSQDFKETIVTISAGITKLTIIEERWDGEIFWMKASIKINRKELGTLLEKVISDRQRIKELEEAKYRLDEALTEIERLKKEGKNHSGTAEKYNGEIKTIASYEYWYDVCSKYDKNDFLGAVKDFTMFIEANPNQAEAYINRGIAKGRLGDLKGEIIDHSQAIKIDSTNGRAFYNRGEVRFEQREFKEAVSDYDNAIKFNPQYAMAYFSRGAAKIKMGINDSACSDLRKAGELGFERAFEVIREYCQ